MVTSATGDIVYWIDRLQTWESSATHFLDTTCPYKIEISMLRLSDYDDKMFLNKTTFQMFPEKATTRTF